MAPIPDLPVELWRHILSFLPSEYIRKVMGISRNLFEMAMDDIYRELLCFPSADKMLDTLPYIRNSKISSRVRHVIIRPFLNSIEASREVEPSNSRTHYTKSFFTLIRRRPPEIPVDPSNRYMKALQDARDIILACTSVSALTVVLRNGYLDITLAPSFKSFLRSLWPSIGAYLRTLSVVVTLEESPIVLDPRLLRHLPNLTEYALHIASSKSDPFPRKRFISEYVVPFMERLPRTLESLHITTSIFIDFNTLFDVINLPSLCRLRISIKPPLDVIFRSSSTSSIPSLASFIERHQSNLRELSVRIQRSVESSPLVEERWIETGAHYLSFPKLRAFEVEIPPFFATSSWLQNWQTGNLFLPPLPQLKSFTLDGKRQSFTGVKALLDALVRSGSTGTLRRIALLVDEMTPELIDMFSDKLPLLKDLDITFKGYKMSQSADGITRHVPELAT
ncbi:hypothetical protein H0H92_011656 [Tricholoma furcatifolium]|nr:hypothetical protein H0H92_011656 [Tricholoma furcatifolium]